MMLNRRDQIVRIVNIADSPKEIADSALSHGKLIVESMKAVYLPMEVFIRVRGRYSDWMRNTAQENNAEFRDLPDQHITSPDEIARPGGVCPHCGKAADDSVEIKPKPVAVGSIKSKTTATASTAKPRTAKPRTAKPKVSKIQRGI